MAMHYPFLLHALLETPAAINFLLRPLQQISTPAPQAEAIIRQYGVLLFVSVIIAAIFIKRPVDSASRHVSGALALYHLAPTARAFSRILTGDVVSGSAIGGPKLHVVVHLGCFLGLLELYINGRAG
ncbi:hypothetical protein BJ878DRAFT_510299 [Calycina marina]|uniref:Uncharacterized protein n=1 Tax=Calycina marina TaxID=1763456 RepID=A0A9P7Z0X0_9HELO|nr:hypothetical protein BJ878DRAFT_510299 [Calycina marina]